MVSLTVIDNEALVDPEPIPDVLEVDSDGDVELAISAPASSKSTGIMIFDCLIYYV